MKKIDDLFSEEEIKDAKLNSISNESTASTHNITVAISRKHKSKPLYKFLTAHGYNLIEIDSQAKYLFLLLGLADSYIRESGSCGTADEYSWDHLPGIHLVNMAGGVVSDLNGLVPKICSNNKYLYFDSFLISSASVQIQNKVLSDLRRYH